MEKREIKKRPRMSCRYCGSPAVFDVVDDSTKQLYGYMCSGCAELLDTLGWDYLAFKAHVVSKKVRQHVQRR